MLENVNNPPKTLCVRTHTHVSFLFFLFFFKRTDIVFRHFAYKENSISSICSILIISRSYSLFNSLMAKCLTGE